MKQEFLSDIELYYSSDVHGGVVILSGSEYKHAGRVMRHQKGDTLFVTDGKGAIYECVVDELRKTEMRLIIIDRKNYDNKLGNIYLCFPRLKNADRFEFELEKAVELGFTNFIIINTERTIPKGAKLDRWNKIALSAMKQSLNSFLPNINYFFSLKELNNLSGEKIILDQKGSKPITENLDKFVNPENKYFFIFGPEGGLSENEQNLIEDGVKLKLTANRLRAETSVVTLAVALSIFMKRI